MKKILVLALAMSIVMVAVGGATYATLSDQEVSQNSLLSAATLDLNINGANGVSNTFSIGATPGVNPGDSGTGNSVLRNVGSIPGSLSIATSAITHSSGTGPATGTWNSKTTPGDIMHTTATMALWIDVNNTGIWSTGDIGLASNGTTYTYPASLQYDVMNNYASKTWGSFLTMATSTNYTFRVGWTVPSGTGNAIQGASASINFIFTIVQQ